jgi:hypothetical protein
MKYRFPLTVFLILSMVSVLGCKTTDVAPNSQHDVTFPYMETDHEWDKKYSDAPYVFLLADNITEVQEDFSYTENIHLVMKIQNEDGMKVGEFPLNYDNSREEIKDIQAFVLTADGRKIGYSSIQDRTTQQGFAVYSDNKVKIITFPNVLIGSIIDIRYKLHHLKPIIENEFFETYYFTSQYPIKYSRRIFIAPNNMPLTIKNSDTSIEPEIVHSDKTIRYTWQAAYKNKIENENFMPPFTELSEQVSISTVADWKRLSKYGWSLFEKNLKSSSELKEAVQKIKSEIKDKRDQVQAVLEYIQNNFRYVSLNIDYHNYEPHSTDRVFYNKYGDCKDQTVLAIEMLSEIGVVAYPALISTYSDLSLRENLTPMLNYFDHVILGIEFENKINYTDLLIKGYKFWEIPSAWSGTNALLLKPGGDSFHQLTFADMKDMTTYIRQKTFLNDDASASGVFSLTFDRSTTSQLRVLMKSMTDSENKRWLSMFAAKIIPGSVITETKAVNLNETYMNLEIQIQFKQKNWAELINDMLVFGVGMADREPAFSALTRQNPIVFRQSTATEIENEYLIPEGYEVVTLPEDLAVESDFAYYKKSYRSEGQRILEKVLSGYKRSYLPANRYQDIEKYYDNLIPLTRKRVAIRKKA